MDNGIYYISVDKTPGETYYLQYFDPLFKLGGSGENGGAAGQFRVTVQGNQLSMHVTINDELAGYVNSFDDGGGDIELHLGDPVEYFNYTEDEDGYKIWTEVTDDGSSFEGYLTAWSSESDEGVYLDHADEQSPNNRAVQKWKFTAVTVEDIVFATAPHTSQGG